ncbi:ankyrin repeat domain-containing protein 7-like, partial [Microtus oregoni]|uniref:ankyrin repeat domain-containing protein 7-like n=1 Tax=Microtus oregoni TaxID=111838 RepID=UPI001BB2613E
MKKIFKGHLPWGFLGFRNANAENQEWHRYLTGYIPVKKIHKAASMGDITQVQRMLEFGDVDVNVTDRKKRTALHYACAHGQAEMAALLLWYECNIEARDSDLSTALIKAAQRQHEECVKVLLENGADSNAIDANQNTALHYAVYNNSTSIAAKLLEFGADTEIKAKNGYTPLILAVLENKLEMVELLLRAAANINALDNYKRSALIHAVRAQSRDMIGFLLQQGADASLVDVYGATAQSYTVFETFQVLSKGPSSTTREDRYNSDAKAMSSAIPKLVLIVTMPFRLKKSTSNQEIFYFFDLYLTSSTTRPTELSIAAVACILPTPVTRVENLK